MKITKKKFSMGLSQEQPPADNLNVPPYGNGVGGGLSMSNSRASLGRGDSASA